MWCFNVGGHHLTKIGDPVCVCGGGGDVTSLTFVKVVDIKVYLNVLGMLNINESSTMLMLVNELYETCDIGYETQH